MENAWFELISWSIEALSVLWLWFVWMWPWSYYGGSVSLEYYNYSGLLCTCNRELPNSKTSIRLWDMNIIILSWPKLSRVIALESIGPNWKDNCFLANSHWTYRGYLSMGLPTDQESIKWFMYTVSQIFKHWSALLRYCRDICTYMYILGFFKERPSRFLLLILVIGLTSPPPPRFWWIDFPMPIESHRNKQRFNEILWIESWYWYSYLIIWLWFCSWQFSV